MAEQQKETAKSTVTTVNLLPRHKRFLAEMKKAERQGASDTIRRALDEYMAKYPLPSGGSDANS